MVCLALLTAFLASTQPHRLAPVDVPATAGSDGDELEPHAAAEVRDANATVTVIEVDERQGAANDLAALVSQAPGAIVQDAGGAGQRKTVSLRGAASNGVLVLLDGVPLGGPGLAVDLSRIPVAALDRLEVLRGGASARYGPGSLGGVINLVSKAPRGTRLFGQVSHGSFSTSQASAGASAPLLGGHGLVLLHALSSEGDFLYRFDDRPSLADNPLLELHRSNNQALQGGALLRYRRQSGPTRAEAMFEGQIEERGLAGTVENPTHQGTQKAMWGTAWARVKHGLSSGGSLSLLGFLRLDDSIFSQTSFGSGRYRQLESQAGGEVVWSDLLLSRNAVTALIAGGGQWLSTGGGARAAEGRLGAMLVDELLLFEGRMTVHGSFRVDVQGPFVAISPQVGVAVSLPKGVELKANAGQASRPPSFFERSVLLGTLMPNPDLRPERGLVGDATASWSGSSASGSLTAFGALYEDLISYEYYPPALAKPYNISAAQVVGAEAQGVLTPWPWLEAGAAYTFLSTQNLRDDPRYYRKALPHRPTHRLHARLAAGPSALRLRAEVTFQSEQFVNRTQTLAIGPRALVSAGVTAKPLRSPELSISVEMQNLLDVQTQDVTGYPLPPRAAFVTLALAWEGVKS